VKGVRIVNSEQTEPRTWEVVMIVNAVVVEAAVNDTAGGISRIFVGDVGWRNPGIRGRGLSLGRDHICSWHCVRLCRDWL